MAIIRVTIPATVVIIDTDIYLDEDHRDNTCADTDDEVVQEVLGMFDVEENIPRHMRECVRVEK